MGDGCEAMVLQEYRVRAWSDFMQAGVTDNVPLHVLGGNIIPVALGQQFMVTEEVRNASLALIVALPAENSTSSGTFLARSKHLIPTRLKSISISV